MYIPANNTVRDKPLQQQQQPLPDDCAKHETHYVIHLLNKLYI